MPKKLLPNQIINFEFESGSKQATLSGVVSSNFVNYCRAKDLNDISDSLNTIINTLNSTEIPSGTSELVNDAGFISTYTDTDLSSFYTRQ